MTWSPVAVLSGVTRTPPWSAMTLGATAAKSGNRKFVVLVIRKEAQQKAPWVKVGARVGINLGSAEHEGYMQVVRDGGHLVQYAGWRKSNAGKLRPVMVKMPPLANRPFAAHRQEAVVFDANGTSIMIELPAWARVPASPAKPATVAHAPAKPDLGPKRAASAGPFHVAPALRPGAGARE